MSGYLSNLSNLPPGCTDAEIEAQVYDPYAAALVSEAAHRLLAQSEASKRDLRARELSYFLVSGDALTDEIRRALDTGDELELGRIVARNL